MKRMLCVTLALVMVLALAACGSRPAQEAEDAVESMMPTMEPTETDAMETMMPDASADPEANGNFPHPDDAEGDEELSTRDVLDAIANVEDDGAGATLSTYAAAAKVLNFCKQGGPAKAGFRDEVKDYFQNMSAEKRTAFTAGYEAVVTLAQNIAKGDVEQSELEQNLTDAGVKLDPIDPVNFEHENLVTFAEAILSQTQNNA